MILLALDCANDGCSAAVLIDGAVAAFEGRELSRGQAEVLMPMVESVMRRAGKDYFDLKAVAVTTGPGSFTGVRIGLATARGIGLAAGLPVVGVSALEVAGSLLANASDKKTCVFFDTKRGDYYAQCFQNGAPAGKAFAGGAEALTALKADVYAGNCPEMFFEQTGKTAKALKIY